MISAPQWTDTVRGIEAVVQAVAIIIGGAWAYFKFARGRTFGKRGDLEARANLVSSGSNLALKVTATFHNVGVSRIFLSPDTAVSIYSVSQATWPYVANFDWGRPVKVTRIFEKDTEVDGQESVTNEVLIPLTAGSTPEQWPAAYRIECFVIAAPPKRRLSAWLHPKEDFWTAETVVPAAKKRGHRESDGGH